MNKNFILLMTRYIIIGFIAAGPELVIFNELMKYFDYIKANSIAYGFGIIVSFTFNKIFNFKIKNKIFIRFNRFLFVNFSGLIISNLFLYIFSGLIPYLHLKIISMPFIVSFQFLLNYFWTFKKQ